jgi:hypothetical protein
LYTIILIILIALAIVGAKSTWDISKKIAGFFGAGVNDLEGIALVVVMFIFIFIIISPVMGVVTIVKKLR